MAWFTEFPVNAVKFISARLEDLCKTESKSQSNNEIIFSFQNRVQICEFSKLSELILNLVSAQINKLSGKFRAQ